MWMRGRYRALCAAVMAVAGFVKGGPSHNVDAPVLSEMPASETAMWQSIPQFTLREIWRNGGVDVIAGQEFAGPFMATAFGPNGVVAVLDQTLVTVTLLDGQNGRFLRRVGRPGQGPGELGSAVAMTWDAEGRLWVGDQRNQRYNVYDSLGVSVATFRRPSRSSNRRVFPIRHVDGHLLLDHDVVARSLRMFTVDTTGSIVDAAMIPFPPRVTISGPSRPESALRDAIQFLPTLRWSFSASGASVWTTRSDSLTLVQIDLAGDTLRRVVTSHRTASFTDEQRTTVRLANRELGRDGGFTPTLVQQLHGLSDGRVLAQIGQDRSVPGREFDMFSPEGTFMGTIHTPFDVFHRSVLDSRGDTLLVHTVGEFDIPVIIKAVIEPLRAPDRR